MLVLFGYVLVLNGTSVGQGWQLLVHLTDHHGTASVHHHGAESEDRHTPVPSWGDLHEHDGHMHTHEPSSDVTVPLLVQLDPHCLSLPFVRKTLPPPLDGHFLSPDATPSRTAAAPDPPPPRRRA